MKKRVFYKVMAYVLLLTLLFPALGSTHTAHAAEVQEDFLFQVSEEELKEEKVLVLSDDVADTNGNIVISGGAWERVIVRSSEKVKKVYLQGIEAEMLIVEGGMEAEVTVSDSHIHEMYITALQTGGISFAEFYELSEAGMVMKDYIPLLFAYYDAMRETKELCPTVVTKGTTEIHDVHVWTDVALMLYDGAVEKVEIETKDTYSSMHVDVVGYNGAVFVEQNRAESEGTSYLGLKIKDSNLKSLEVKGESGSCHVDGDRATVENMKVSGAYSVVTSVDTKEIVLDETAKKASVRVYSDVEKIDVQGDHNRVILSASAEVATVTVAGDDAKVYGWGDLKNAVVTGGNAQVAVPGADVEGEHDATIPDEMYDMIQTPDTKPSKPSTPSTPSTPEEPDEPDTPVVPEEPDTPEEPEEEEVPHEHSWEVEEANCVTAKVCGTCGFVAESATGVHTFGQTGVVTAPTCTTPGYTTYTCKFCDATELGDIVDATGHTVTKWEVGSAVTGKTCEYTQQGVCTSCEETIVSETTVTKHNTSLKVVIATEATCTTDGVKKYYCPDCDTELDSKTYSNPEAHTWVKGTEADGKIPYTCACGATKYEVSMSASGVSSEVLNAETEVKLESEVVIALDTATINQVATKEEEGTGATVNTTVKLTAETLGTTEKEEAVAALTEAEKEQLGDSDIYDFSMLVDDEPVTEFSGSVTVRIPYELEEGEDPDAIIVWYIADDGTVQKITDGVTYNAGYVTFTTTHFSYYSVVKMSAAERCAAYGHIWVDIETAPTCKTAGYTTSICQRCSETKTTTGAAATGHSMASEVIQEADCGQNGITRNYCTKCAYEYETVITMKAHTLTKGATVDATCLEPGYTKYSCTCGYEKNEVIPATGHVDGGNGTCTQCGAVLKCDHGDLKVEASLVSGATSCEDGAIIRVVCRRCGELIDERETTAHDTVEIDRISLETYAPGCESYIYVSECACGESGTWYSIGFGDWDNWERDENYADSDHYTGTYTYADSGLRIEETWEYTQIEGCKYHYVMNMEVYLNDVLKATYETDTNTMRHWYYNRFELAEGATSCEDGVYNIMVCENCGLEEKSDWLVYEHMIGEEIVDLSTFGNTCGGTITLYKCACGEVSENIHDNLYCNLSMEFNQYKDEDGNLHNVIDYTCQDCALSYTYHSYGIPQEDCTEYRSITYTIFIDGTQVKELHSAGINESHNWVQTVRLLEGATSCEQGVEYVLSCADCGLGNEPEIIYHHATVEKAVIDYSQYEDSCGSKFYLRGCACGEDIGTWMSNYCNGSYEWDSYTDDDNVVHDITSFTCDECAASFVWDMVEVQGEGCTVIQKRVETYYYDGVEVGVLEYTSYTECHDLYFSSVTLRDGSVTCEDGVDFVSTCRDCGYVEDGGWCYDHRTALVDSVDLSQYGACGGYIEMYECACGAEANCEVEFGCDTGESWSSMLWGSYDLISETSTTKLYRAEYPCAVENCDFIIILEKIQTKVDDCHYTSEVYFCIDSNQDGTYEKKVLVREELREEHAGETTETSYSTVNGYSVMHEITSCDACGTLVMEADYTDFANNGEYDYMTRVRHYYEDGWWDQMENVYEFTADGCTCTSIHTDCEGYYYHNTTPENVCRWSGTFLTEPTCTQRPTAECIMCNNTFVVNHAPNDHRFVENTDGSGYTCMDCGMESAKSYSGSIVLEDLSDDSNYVAGYWNKGFVNFNIYMMIDGYIMDVSMTHVEEYDSGRIYVSKADAKAYAQSNGLSGTYSICFVDEENGTSFEITFE